MLSVIFIYSSLFTVVYIYELYVK